MIDSVTKEQIQEARRADLYSVLLSGYSNAVEKEGKQCLRMKFNHSLVVCRGWSGYKDHATGETGNGIDLLTKHFGIRFQDAVMILAGAGSVGSYNVTEKKHYPPVRMSKNTMVWQYLRGRGISEDMLKYLFDARLLYQSEKCERYNSIYAVFISSAGDYWEMHSPDKNMPEDGRKRVYTREGKSNAYWSLGRGRVAYVCESAIDAISLSFFHKGEDASFCSIGGLGNDNRINHIIADHKEVVLAVDNDKAGDACRERFSYLESIKPTIYKDWNEYLCQQIKKSP